jgi:hypothetical protein
MEKIDFSFVLLLNCTSLPVLPALFAFVYGETTMFITTVRLTNGASGGVENEEITRICARDGGPRG